MATGATEPEAPGWLAWAAAGAILAGAFLLFQVQPLICKLILPRFGGGQAVWTTCMLVLPVAAVLRLCLRPSGVGGRLAGRPSCTWP